MPAHHAAWSTSSHNVPHRSMEARKNTWGGAIAQKTLGHYAMTFKVQVGPAQIAIHQGNTLVCESDGAIAYPSERLYFDDTRIVSSWSLYADGQRWDLLSGVRSTTTSAVST